MFFLLGCSTQKNTKTTRLYHAINTKYNIYFNANEAYKEALKNRQESYQDTLSQFIPVFPVQGSAPSQDFMTSVDKTTKAIKLHSIKAKPVRDPAKRKDPKYKLWLQQQEFNPFLKNAWLLLGKSEYQNGDYLQAISTLTYITRLYRTNPEVLVEARIWLIKANIALGWMYEAEDILNQIRLAGGVPDNLQLEYNKIYADFLVRKEEYKKVIPYLEKAIDRENNQLQKVRMKYLLGQIYQKEGLRSKAYEVYDQLQGLSTPYFYSFNARIQQSTFVDNTNKDEILFRLKKMERDPKNKEYLDQVYYAIGNIHLNEGDSLKAIANYIKALDKSTRNGPEKGIVNAVLGDIYFQRKDYINAQPLYSEALMQISKKDEKYTDVVLRAPVLEELVVYVKAVHLQDSLQELAQMPESDRLDAINKIIEQVKKKEKEEKQKEIQTNRESDSGGTLSGSPMFEQNTPDIPNQSLPVGKDATLFYFYNPQLIAQGKVAFQRKWGVRKLEDNWRRKNKEISFTNSFDSNNELIEQTAEKEVLNEQETMSTSTDIYSVDFYLQQIPLTEEALKASNNIIEDAYFNMGKIYKDRLGNYDLAVAAFTTDLKRFPETSNKEEIYYQLFLIYLRLGEHNQMKLYRANILANFPNGIYAPLLQEANYEWNLLNMYKVQDDLYQTTYQDYLEGKTNIVRSNYETMLKKYPLSDLMPKFMLLNALTYAQTADARNFKKYLEELVKKYPKSDVAPLVINILQGIADGRELAADNSPIRGMIWDIKLGADSIGETKGFDFIVNPDSEHLLLFVYQPQNVDKNELIYQVANYNFSYYVYQTFDLGFVRANSLEMLQVKGFDNFKDITSYIDKAFENNSLMSKLDPSIITIPISTDNYIALMNGKTLNQYFLFLEKNYTTDMLNLIKYWTKQKNNTKGNNLIPENEKKETIEDESQSEIEQPKEELIPTESDTLEVDKSQYIPKSEILPEEEKIENESGKNGIGLGNILTDDQIEKGDRIINKTVDFVKNPVDGLKNILNSPKSNKTKKEKNEEKRLRQLQEEEEKRQKVEEEAKIKAEQEAAEEREAELERIEKERERAIEEARKAREREAEEVRKAREKARKEYEQERKAKERARKEELKHRERERKEALKRKEADRKEQLKRREQERKEQLKQRETERKEKLRLARERQK